MKYYITFQTQSFSSGTLLATSSGPSYIETTWAATEEELPSVMARIDANKHKVIRVIKGVEVKFVQELKILE